MKITITTRRMEITEPLREYINNKVAKLAKFKENIQEAHAILSVEKYRQLAEIYISGNGFSLSSTAETHDMYASVDEAIEKLERQAKKLKKKIIDSKRGGARGSSSETMGEESTEDDLQHSLVKVEAFVSKPMSVEEAVMQLETEEQDIVMFRNAETDFINVVYVRADGTMGLVESE
jgi:putative sigma-54 modulation protein